MTRFGMLADYETFDRVAAITEGRSSTAAGLLRRARARSAVHRFAEALADLEAAERLSAAGVEMAELR